MKTRSAKTERREREEKSAELPISNRKSFNRLFAALCAMQCGLCYAWNVFMASIFMLRIRNVCGMCVRAFDKSKRVPHTRSANKLSVQM